MYVITTFAKKYRLVKRIYISILLLALLTQSFHRVMIVTSYYTNREVYAKNCENKAKPKLHCNGKCQMMKKMKQEENKDKQNPERRSNVDEVLSSKSFFVSIQPVRVLNLVHSSFYISRVPVDRSTEFFHPPGA